jgi:hypothetical protein
MDHFGGKALLGLDIPDWEESPPLCSPVLKVFSERGTFTGPGGSMEKQISWEFQIMPNKILIILDHLNNIIIIIMTIPGHGCNMHLAIENPLLI